jgi:hypothetical protein
VVVKGQQLVGLGAEALNKGMESNGLSLGSSSQCVLDKTDLGDCVNSL